MISKCLIENISKTFLNDGYENQRNHSQNIVNNCCLNVLCILFIKYFMMNV